MSRRRRRRSEETRVFETTGRRLKNGEPLPDLMRPTMNFVVNAESEITIAVYSRGAIGRVVTGDALGFTKYAQSAAK